MLYLDSCIINFAAKVGKLTVNNIRSAARDSSDSDRARMQTWNLMARRQLLFYKYSPEAGPVLLVSSFSN
jgi:hypothetical protein